MPDLDRVFKALADANRRRLLDLLRQRNGQSLSELCAHLEITRQSAAQHLGILEEANLIVTERVGREKFHYLNAVPLYQIYRRWIRRFDLPRVEALDKLKRRLEETPNE